MTKDEIKLVAEVLAKIGGEWYPERAESRPRMVSNRHREIARVVLAAVERAKAANEPQEAAPAEVAADEAPGTEDLQVGATVLYRPPADKRTLPCRIERIEGDRAFVVPEQREIGWVSTHSLLPLTPVRETAARPARAPINTASQEPLDVAPEVRPKGTEAYARPVYYFSSDGEWIAFSRSDTDRYLFNQHGHWIGWFPADNGEIADINGDYLGTVFDRNRIYRKAAPQWRKRDLGFVPDPGDARYLGSPGFTASSPLPHKCRDLDMARIPTRNRSGLTNSPRLDAGGQRKRFEIWLSKIGLGRLGRAIDVLVRPDRGR